MTIYIIDDFTITAHSVIPTDLPARAIVIATESDLIDLAPTPAERLKLWRGIPDVVPLKKPPSLSRIWQALETLAPADVAPPALSPFVEAALNAVAAIGNPSRQSELLALLRRSAGATLVELMAATGWQKHSVRGFIAGTVKKKLGLFVESTKIDGNRSYRIVGGDE